MDCVNAKRRHTDPKWFILSIIVFFIKRRSVGYASIYQTYRGFHNTPALVIFAITFNATIVISSSFPHSNVLVSVVSHSLRNISRKFYSLSDEINFKNSSYSMKSERVEIWFSLKFYDRRFKSK